MAVTARAILWAPFYNNGMFLALQLNGQEHQCLPVFSSYPGCAQWLANVGLDDEATPSIPLYPRNLIQMLDTAERAGFDFVTLDPPHEAGQPAERMPLEELRRQARERS